MGTDLIIISNYRVAYREFDFDRLGREVAARLNQTRLPNPEFYWLSRLHWENSAWNSSPLNARKMLVPWTFCSDRTLLLVPLRCWVARPRRQPSPSPTRWASWWPAPLPLAEATAQLNQLLASCVPGVYVLVLDAAGQRQHLKLMK